MSHQNHQEEERMERDTENDEYRLTPYSIALIVVYMLIMASVIYFRHLT
jgi:hypothetical protein